MTIDKDVSTLMERIQQLATFSEEPDRLTRRFATEALRQANDAVAGWMRDAGMTVWQDHIGNLRGRYEAESADAKTLLLGSHLDSVRDAGKYDGPLGVLVALACVERLHDQQRRLPFAVELVAFADEEGLRFGTSYLGSKVIAGTFDPSYWERTDADGITMAEALRSGGGDPDKIGEDHRPADDLLGYCEVHIEQGPVLESKNLPVGVVLGITGQSRFTVRFNGEAGHAGTVPMTNRRDALCAAAEFILTAEALALNEPGLVATVGQADVQPGASNVIPGSVTLSLDVRHQSDEVRQKACDKLHEQAQAICARRKVNLNWRRLQENQAVPCAEHLKVLLAQAIEQSGYPVIELPSGAGHDAVALSDLTSVAMLFVRCKDGISHNPAESVKAEDVAVAINVVSRFMDLLADEQARS
jgi:allantoate deiminase